MSDKERIEALEKEGVHSVRARVALEKRVSVLEGIVFSREQPDDVFNEGLEAPKPKPIDWSKVAACVPVSVWDDSEEDVPVVLYLREKRGFNSRSAWKHCSLITGIDIAWSGGECPLPEGVMIQPRLRNERGIPVAEDLASEFRWRWNNDVDDIISFRITGIADGWTEDLSTTKEVGE